MKTLKEYLLSSKDFDRFIEMYADDITNPAAVMLWEVIRQEAVLDALRNCDCEEHERENKNQSGSTTQKG